MDASSSSCFSAPSRRRCHPAEADSVRMNNDRRVAPPPVDDESMGSPRRFDPTVSVASSPGISPNCVIDEVTRVVADTRLNQQRRLREDPDLLKTFEVPDVTTSTKSVSICPEVIEHDPPTQWTMEDLSSQFWKSVEIREFSEDARRAAKSFLRRNPEFPSKYIAVFQGCVSDDMNKMDSVKTLQEFPTDLRGLESRAIQILRQYRRFHVQSVLEAASDQDYEAILRSRSLRTSKPCRALARLLALQDSMTVASIIREELIGEIGEKEYASKSSSSHSSTTTSSLFHSSPSAGEK
jgi:hypothetical protein